MSKTAVYHTTVRWTEEHWGHLEMGNGPQMPFAPPPDAQGYENAFTPEDAFVAAANTCIMLMFLWATKRFKLNLLAYECRAEGTKLVEFDQTERFTHLRLYPQIKLAANGEREEVILARAQRALQTARKYSLVANSVNSEISIEPTLTIVSEK